MKLSTLNLDPKRVRKEEDRINTFFKQKGEWIRCARSNILMMAKVSEIFHSVVF